MLICGRFNLALSRPLVMGIVNITPDSFSDGGRYASLDKAIAHAHQLVDQGADILDLGAESTRPGAQALPVALEVERLLPLVRELSSLNVPLSVDTYKPEVMRLALAAGADMINSVQGFRSSESIQAIQGSGAGLCVMHMQGEPESMQVHPHYSDVVAEVSTFWLSQLESLTSAGIRRQQLCLDPGFGFGKSLEHNYRLMNELATLKPLDLPRLIGVSRKSMIGAVTGRPVNQRLAGSLSLALAAVARGAKIIRVHDVLETVDALNVWACVEQPSKVVK